ncbi:MAG TPA: hypothetical protein VF657_15670 [Actinoplanes sp.]
MGDPIVVAADQRGGIAAARGQVRGVRAESDFGTRHQPVQLVRALHDRRQVRVVAGAQTLAFGDSAHRVQRRGEPVVVLRAGTGGAPGSATHDEASRLERGGQLRRPLDAVELVGQHIGVDEVRARVHAHQFDAGPAEQVTQLVRPVGVRSHVAVEHLGARVTGRGDVAYRLLHRAVGPVVEILDAGHAGRIADDTAPGDRVVTQSHARLSLLTRHRSGRSTPRLRLTVVIGRGRFQPLLH